MAITNTIKNFLSETGNIAHFTGRYLSLGISPPYEIKEFLTQCYIIGYRSLGLLSLTGFIIGLVQPRSGFEVIKFFTTYQKDVPVVVLSTLAEEENTVEESFLLGVADFIAKPFNPNELLLRIKRLL